MGWSLCSRANQSRGSIVITLGSCNFLCSEIEISAFCITYKLVELFFLVHPNPDFFLSVPAFCHSSRETLASLCSFISGDALLFSMFREGASPVECPFTPPHTFTYNRGHGECKYPVSSIEACTHNSRLLLSYQACPDVYGSESHGELNFLCSFLLSIFFLQLIWLR